MAMEMMGVEAGGEADRPAHRTPRRLSQVFAELAAEPRERITMADIRDRLGDRGFAAMVVLFGALNLLPLPPPSSAILGLPLLIVAAQMTYGAKRAWLPRFVADKSLSSSQFRSMVNRGLPYLQRLETIIRPRLWPFSLRRGERIVGLGCFLLAVIVTLPIPLGNWLPACAATLLGLALTERDGTLLAAGAAVAVIALCVVTAVVGAAGLATQAALGWIF